MDKRSCSTNSWEYIDFELEIREGGPHEYPVAVRSPAGEAREEMRFPFDEQELKDKLKDLENAVLLSGTRRRRLHSPEVQIVQDFGQTLFKALLHGEVRAHYEESLREARRQNKGLRLKLRILPPRLAGLPWEFLYDSDQGQYLCLSSKTPLVRYPELRETIEQVPVTPPLRILGMVASPYDLSRLKVEKEKQCVKEAIRDLEAQGRVELTWLEGQTPRDLLRAMRRGPWHVFHFIGHGDFDPDREEGLIALADEDGNARFLRGEDLAQLLKDHWDLRLVLLNSCEGARGSEHDAFSSTAARLVRPGIPAVVANQYEISDQAAVEFSRAFYEAVADGLPLDAAVAGARTSLKIEIGDTLEWGTPVLYMRSPDGRVFDIQEEEEENLKEKKDSLRRYRQRVESVWVDGELNRREAEWLSDYANNELRLSPSTAADIERKVMGDTVEAILEHQERDTYEEQHEVTCPEAEEIKADPKQGAEPNVELETGPATIGASSTGEETKPASKQNSESDGKAEPVRVTAAARRRAEELGVDLRAIKGTGAGGRITVADIKKTATEARISRELNEAEVVGQEMTELSHVPQDSPPRSKRIVLLATVVGILLVLLTGGGAMAVTGVGPGNGFLGLSERPPIDGSPPAPSTDAQEDAAVGDESMGETTSTASGDSDVPEDDVEPEGDNQATSESQNVEVPETVKVPDLTGRSRSEASSMVTTAGLKLGSQNEAPSNDVPKGEIVRQNPAAEVKVEQGSTVDVTFSSGPKQIAVPKVVGGNVEEAKQTLANAGLGYIVETVQNNASAGTVVSTDPPAGTLLDPSKKVTLKQSAGPVNKSGKTAEQQAEQAAAEKYALESEIMDIRHQTMKKTIENIENGDGN